MNAFNQPNIPGSDSNNANLNSNNLNMNDFESNFFNNIKMNMFADLNQNNPGSTLQTSGASTNKANEQAPSATTDPNAFKTQNISGANSKPEDKASNPFVDAYSEMSQTPLDTKNIMDLLAGLGDLGGNSNANLENFNDDNLTNIMGLYEILAKLSDQKELDKNLSEEEKEKHLKALFENLLEFLLKSNMLAEPLMQIKNSVNSYLEKNKNTLKPEEEEKYKSMLDHIDVINREISKAEPNKPLIIDTFFKLHELSNLDDNILDQINPSFKEFSDLFNKKK